MDVLTNLHERLRAELSALALESGFQQEPKKFVRARHCYHRWSRQASWKTEAIDLVYKVRWQQWFYTSVGIYMPPLPGFEELAEDLFDGYSPGTYRTGRGVGAMLTLQTRRVTRRVLRDVRNALPWFGNFTSPRSCLDRLERGETIFAFARGPAIVARIEWLKALSDDGSDE